MDPLLLLPELLLFVGGLGVLLLGSFLPRYRQWVARLTAAAVLVAAIVAAGVAMAGPATTAFSGTVAVDIATGAARIVAPAAALLVLVLAGDELAGAARESETYALILFATTGTVLLAGARDLLILAVAFLLTSIPTYALIGLHRSARAAEAAMKTYLLGNLFGILMLAGVAVLYGVAGTSVYGELGTGLAAAPTVAVIAGLVLTLGGLLFEVGAAPAHFWVPDAATASSGTVAAFVTTVPKVGALIASYRLVAEVPSQGQGLLIVGVIAVASMTIGNLAAYFQEDARRLLGWSTVGQAGFLLIPAAVASRSDEALPSLLFYTAAYAAANLAAFAVTLAEPGRRTLAEYRGLAGRRPWLAAALIVALLGLVGTPPIAVFVGKLTVGAAAWDAGAPWLTVALLGFSVVSLFYYLRWLIPVFRTEHAAAEQPDTAGAPTNADVVHAADGTGELTARGWASGVAVIAAALGLALGIGAGLIWSGLGGVLA